MKHEVKCKICRHMFNKKFIGRYKILRKEEQGESVAWVCPHCAKSVKITDILI